MEYVFWFMHENVKLLCRHLGTLYIVDSQMFRLWHVDIFYGPKRVQSLMKFYIINPCKISSKIYLKIAIIHYYMWYEYGYSHLHEFGQWLIYLEKDLFVLDMIYLSWLFVHDNGFRRRHYSLGGARALEVIEKLKWRTNINSGRCNV